MTHLAKYFGTNEDGHQGRLVWPGTVDGFPVRVRGSTNPLLTSEQVERMPTVLDAKVKTFDLSNEEDLDQYRDILDRHFNGWYRITTRREAYDADTKNWRVQLEWVQIYGELSPVSSLSDYMGPGGST